MKLNVGDEITVKLSDADPMSGTIIELDGAYADIRLTRNGFVVRAQLHNVTKVAKDGS